MSLTHAFKIKQIARCDEEIREHIIGILNTIESEIQSTLYQKEDEVVIELPTIFNTGIMSNADAQRLVYYYTLKVLDEAGYVTRVIIKGQQAETQKVYFIIQWLTLEDKRERQFMDQYIASKCVKSQPKHRNRYRKK